MNIALLGPPGAGKGTQAKKLFAEFGMLHISTGDILRAAVQQGTELGRKAQPLMSAGKLVPDEIMIGIIEERLKKSDCSKGFALDGFPRTIPQAEALERVLRKNNCQLDRVISLEVPEEVLVERLSGRRICPADGAVYHVLQNPPLRAGFCDKCSTGLVQRDDDKEDKVRERLRVYAASTEPLKAFYRKKGLLTEINGVGSPEGIYVEVRRALEPSSRKRARR
jgi:adenylate kinase